MEIQPEITETTDPNQVEGQVDMFNHPVPGESLTSEGGARLYEYPPETNDPEEVIRTIIGYIENDEEEKDRILSALLGGMPVEALVQTFALGGVANGKFSPDVAELIKPALALFFAKMAIDEGISVIMFTDEKMLPEEREAQLTKDTMEAMAVARPEMHKAMKGRRALDKVKGRLEEVKNKSSARKKIENIDKNIPVESDGSFLEMEEV